MNLILKPTDTARIQEVTDSETATDVVLEPLNVRRGGRARGRKGVTAKETAQVHDLYSCVSKNPIVVCIVSG